MLVTLGGQKRATITQRKMNCTHFDVGGVRNFNIGCKILKQLRGLGRDAPWGWGWSINRAVYWLT